MRHIPADNTIVSTTGSPSGIAETASAVAINKISVSD